MEAALHTSAAASASIVTSRDGGEPQDADYNEEGGEDRRGCQTYRVHAACRRAGSFVKPVDEKTILNFFGSPVVIEEDEQGAMIAKTSSSEDDDREAMIAKFSKCSAFEGIPNCLGSRLSRKLPGEADFFQIDILDLRAAAAADARLAEIFTQLRSESKPIIWEQQVLEQLRPSGTDVIAMAQPTNVRWAPQVDGISPDAPDTGEEEEMAASPTSDDLRIGNPASGLFHASLIPYIRYSCAHSGSNLDRHYAYVQSRVIREDPLIESA